MPTPTIYWKGRPHHHLPRVHTASCASACGNPNLAAEDVVSLPFGKRLERARLEERIKARGKLRQRDQRPQESSESRIRAERPSGFPRSENSAARTGSHMLRADNHSGALAGSDVAARIPRGGTGDAMGLKPRTSFREHKLRNNSRVATITRVPINDNHYSLLHTSDVYMAAACVSRRKLLITGRIVMDMTCNIPNMHLSSRLSKPKQVAGSFGKGPSILLLLLKRDGSIYIMHDVQSRLLSVGPVPKISIYLHDFTILYLDRQQGYKCLKDLACLALPSRSLSTHYLIIPIAWPWFRNHFQVSMERRTARPRRRTRKRRWTFSKMSYLAIWKRPSLLYKTRARARQLLLLLSQRQQSLTSCRTLQSFKLPGWRLLRRSNVSVQTRV